VAEFIYRRSNQYTAMTLSVVAVGPKTYGNFHLPKSHIWCSKMSSSMCWPSLVQIRWKVNFLGAKKRNRKTSPVILDEPSATELAYISSFCKEKNMAQYAKFHSKSAMTSDISGNINYKLFK